MPKFVRLLLAGPLLVACGDLTVPDFNNPSIEELRTSPTPAAVTSAATGLLVGARANMAAPNAYISLLGILGRESYNFDIAEPRFITEMLMGPMSPSGAFGGNLWSLRYRNIRNANIILDAVDGVAAFTDAEKEAIRGFARTMQALDYLLVINTRDTNGAPIEVSRPLTEEPAPIESKEAVFSHIVELLDQGQVHLEAGGGSFPFPLSSGFEGFDTPETFLLFNRGLKARVEVYRGEFQSALDALDASFVSTSAPLDLGVYHVFGTASGETPNLLSQATLRAHPSIVEDAESQPGGEVDQRVQDKIETVPNRTQLGLASNLAFTMYATNEDPVPILRNEELILLRAEANIGAGEIDEAIEDINFIRVNSGGLAPRTDLTAGNILDELLLQKRYSLLFEGHRWIDLRRYDRLDELPLDAATHTVQERFPIPEAEQLAR